MAGISHKTKGTQLTQVEFEVADSHDLSTFPFAQPTIAVVANNAKNASEYTPVAGKVYVCDATADNVQIQAGYAALP